MTVRIYKSTDASAPVLTGQAGSLIALLDACLINGYGALAGSSWTKEFSGTNLAVYRPPVGGNRFRLRIDDTGTTNGRGVGYESMSDVNTGTGDFPTAAQFSGGMYWPKSTTADATARAWIIAATDRMLIMHVNSASAANSTTGGVCVFGDIKSYKSGDAYGTIHIAGTSSTPNNANTLQTLATALSGACAGHYVARTYAQTGASLQVGKHTDLVKSISTTRMGEAGMTYPSPPDGGLYIAPLWVHETTGSILRGTIPGLWAPMHDRPLQHLDTMSGTGALAGRTFLALKMYNNNTGSEVFLEVSDTWDI